MSIAGILFENPEVHQSCFFVSANETWCFADATQVFSNWQRARSAVTVCLNYREKLLKKVKSDLTTSELDNKSCERQQIRTVEHLQKADIEIYKSVQMAHFEADVKALKMNRKTLEESCPKDSVIPSKHLVKKSSPLYRLDPFCDPR